MGFVYVVVGVALVIAILEDAFEAVVLPRRVSRPYRFTRFYYRTTWKICVSLADASPSRRVRKALLSGFGPMSIFGLFTSWAICLVLGFGLLHYVAASGSHSLGNSMYMSGVTFTTLGYGDMVPTNTIGRLLAVSEALVGFGFLAVVIGFLPVFYQAFSHRELMISLLDARAGSPPSAGQMLVRLPPHSGEALNRFLYEAERWAGSLLEGHLSYPVLSYYRSQHDNQSWLATLTCTLDTCALILTVVEGADRQQAQLTFAMARHALVDISLTHRQPPIVQANDRFPIHQFGELVQKLRDAGITVRDIEPAQAKLIELRSLYEPFAEGLAAYLRLELPPVWRSDNLPDNWQTSAWARRAAGFAQLALEPGDDHND